MSRLEKLTYFGNKHATYQKAAQALQTEAQATDAEWTAWLESEFGFKGNMHMAEVMKVAIESSYDAPKIITN